MSFSKKRKWGNSLSPSTEAKCYKLKLKLIAHRDRYLKTYNKLLTIKMAKRFISSMTGSYRSKWFKEHSWAEHLHNEHSRRVSRTSVKPYVGEENVHRFCKQHHGYQRKGKMLRKLRAKTHSGSAEQRLRNLERKRREQERAHEAGSLIIFYLYICLSLSLSLSLSLLRICLSFSIQHFN